MPQPESRKPREIEFAAGTSRGHRRPNEKSERAESDEKRRQDARNARIRTIQGGFRVLPLLVPDSARLA